MQRRELLSELVELNKFMDFNVQNKEKEFIWVPLQFFDLPSPIPDRMQFDKVNRMTPSEPKQI